MDITRKEETQRYRELVITSEGVAGNTNVGEGEVDTAGDKTDSRVYQITGEIRPMFCNNCKWRVTFKSILNFLKKLKQFFQWKNIQT